MVLDKELKKVKEKIVSELILGLESSDAYAEYYGVQEILKRPIEIPKEK